MRKLRLLKLKLQDFRGEENRTIKFDGEDRVLAGTNEAGKTTIADAYKWLLSDEDSKGNTRFEIKPLDSNNNPIHHLNSIVEGQFQLLKDGKFEREFTLKKDYHEVWRRKKGTTTEVMKGHTTDYYIDEVEESKGDYEEYIDNIIDYDTLKLITDPLYFNEQLHWTEQQEIIFNMVDRPKPTDVATKIEKYYLAEKLENKSVEKFEKELKNKMKKLDDQLKTIPASINEVQKTLSSYDIQGDEQELKIAIQKLEKRLEELQVKKAELKNDSQSAVMKKIIDLKAELQNKKEKLLENANNRLDQYEREKRKLESAELNYRTRINNLENTIELNQNKKERAEERRKELLAEYHEVDNKTFDDDAKVCDKCGQDLPEEQVEKIKAKFNKKKSDDLIDIKSKGIRQAENIEEAEDNIKTALAGVKDIEEKIENLDYKTVEEGLDKGAEYKSKIKNNELEGLKELADEINELQDKKPDTEPEKLTDVNAEIADIKTAIKTKEKQINNIDNKKKAEARIDELQQQEQIIIDNHEKLDRTLADLDKYVKAEIEMIEDDVNDMFDITTFKLFDKQVNGDIKETCEAMKGGVPYSELNTGSQYKVGMDIIKTLTNHFGITAPIFIDNRERIARLPEVDSQTVHLVMTPEYKELKMLNMSNEDEREEFIEEKAGITRDKLF